MREMAFCTSDFIIIKSNYFRNARKGECFLDDFKALVREIDVRGELLRPRNVILKRVQLVRKVVLLLYKWEV
jgi:hypothetical protein